MGNIYLIELYNQYERFFKIGITVHRYCRFYQLMKFGYRARIVYMVMGIDYFEALTLESKLKSLFTSYIPNKKFGGYTECFEVVDLDTFIKESTTYKHKEIVENIEISWR